MSLGSGPHDTGEYLLGVGAVAGAIAAADLSDDDGGANGLFGAPVGCVDRRVPQEGEHGRELGGQVRGEAVGIVEPRRRVDQPSEAGEQSAARGGQAVVGQASAVAAVAHVEGRLQDVLDVGGPRVVRMVLPEFPAPSEQVRQTATAPSTRFDRENVGDLRMVWSRGLTQRFQSGTPLAYRGVLYMRNPNDVIQAVDAVTGDLIWEHRRDVPDDVGEYLLGALTTNNRNIAIYDRLIIDTSVDTHVFALDAGTGEMVWETQVLDYHENAAMQGAGPIIAGGKAVSGRSCLPRDGPEACVVVAHDALTEAEVWRRLIPGPGEPGDESWGGAPFEERTHVGAWMVPSYDPALNLVYLGTSVTSPAPKFMLGGVDNQHLYHDSTLALEADTGEIRWFSLPLTETPCRYWGFRTAPEPRYHNRAHTATGSPGLRLWPSRSPLIPA